MTSQKPLPPDEINLFKEAMKDVRPLKTNPKVSLKKTPSRTSFSTQTMPSEPIVTNAHLNTPTRRNTMRDGSEYWEPIARETTVSFFREGLDAKLLSKLKKGTHALEGRIDLHGLNRLEAADHLQQFLEFSYVHRRRVVLIIHGKGNPDAKHITLKTCVSYWLKDIPYVLAFHSARPKDGGTGALYVLLKTSQ